MLLLSGLRLLLLGLPCTPTVATAAAAAAAWLFCCLAGFVPAAGAGAAGRLLLGRHLKAGDAHEVDHII